MFGKKWSLGEWLVIAMGVIVIVTAIVGPIIT